LHFPGVRAVERPATAVVNEERAYGRGKRQRVVRQRGAAAFVVVIACCSCARGAEHHP